jgi:hypothetical protein
MPEAGSAEPDPQPTAAFSVRRPEPVATSGPLGWQGERSGHFRRHPQLREFGAAEFESRELRATRAGDL